MAGGCETEGCTVVDTGICLLGNAPDACSHRTMSEEITEGSDDGAYGAPVLEAPDDVPALWSNLPLDLSDLKALMRGRRCMLVGVLGTPAAGKTAALVSLYLLLSHGNLKGYQFSDSTTLMAFEEISQGARRWGRPPPEEMTARTETSSGRSAGFLHVQIRDLAKGDRLDFVVPDLPGEWSDALIDTNRTDRLDFLRSADVIWVFVNGFELRQAEMRMHTLSRTSLLLRRTSAMLGTNKPPVKIVISHADLGKLPQGTLSKISDMATSANLTAEIIDIASFSNEENVAPGMGLSTLISSSTPGIAPYPILWPDIGSSTERFMLRYERGAPQ